jgi:hypothetical protein
MAFALFSGQKPSKNVATDDMILPWKRYKIAWTEAGIFVRIKWRLCQNYVARYTCTRLAPIKQGALNTLSSLASQGDLNL